MEWTLDYLEPEIHILRDNGRRIGWVTKNQDILQREDQGWVLAQNGKRSLHMTVSQAKRACEREYAQGRSRAGFDAATATLLMGAL